MAAEQQLAGEASAAAAVTDHAVEAITTPPLPPPDLTAAAFFDVDTAADAGDSALRAEFGDRLPVVLLDGAEHSYWEVDEPRLRADLADL